LCTDEGMRNRIGVDAAATAKDWSWDRSAEALWDLLNTVAQKKSGR
jgi:hypothetical protein